jgi:hypothetical protein
MSTCVPKVLKFFNSIDPFKEFARLPQSHRLIALHAQILCVSLIGFFVYVGFSIRVYVNASEASEQTSSIIMAKTQVLFKLVIAAPTNSNFAKCNPSYPESISLPQNGSLTKVVSSYLAYTKVDDFAMTYDVYPFPVYGTVGSGSQTILVFNPCQRLASPEEHRIFPLIISLHTD